MIKQLKSLGPGLLFAGAAIGVSHLVQSTRAGANFEFNLSKEFLKEHPPIILKFLPLYSPNLNIIEILWEIIKKKVALQ